MKLAKMLEVCAKASPGPWTTTDNRWPLVSKGVPVVSTCCCGGFVRADDADFVEVFRDQVPKLLEFAGQAEFAAQQLSCICDQVSVYGGLCPKCWITGAKAVLEAE